MKSKSKFAVRAVKAALAGGEWLRPGCGVYDVADTGDSYRVTVVEAIEDVNAIGRRAELTVEVSWGDDREPVDAVLKAAWDGGNYDACRKLFV